jgi:catechol 2,3-dioxygenase-like lactoylglutathione lyase family enzyme
MSLFIDHVVMTVKDINKSIFFYSSILEMELVDFVSTSDFTERKSLKFGNQKINLHEYAKPFKPHANNPLPGSLDICFISEKVIDEWILTFTRYNIDIEDGPVLKTGANGPIKSIYIRDPDQNLIEISNVIQC